MPSQDHIKVSRLLDSAIDGVVLTHTEMEHQASCEACQDLFEIFRAELSASATADAAGAPVSSKFAA
ncbi:MAG TPA: hypothetical protein VER98_02835 [Terriglobia bacterium]|nr:hypothetical protein [Terriglobia bacterium]